MRRAAALAVVVFGLGAAAGCGGGNDRAQPREDAGLFMKRLLEQQFGGRFALAWETLHPAHQAVAPRSEFVGCASQSALPDGIDVEVVEVRDEPITIPGQAREVVSKAVTLQLHETTGSFDQTFHAIAVKGDWKWIFSGPTFDAYKQGICP